MFKFKYFLANLFLTSILTRCHYRYIITSVGGDNNVSSLEMWEWKIKVNRQFVIETDNAGFIHLKEDEKSTLMEINMHTIL